MHTLASVAVPAPVQDTARANVPPLEAIQERYLEAKPMYPDELTAEGKRKHSRHCLAQFARRDWNCHRCVELLHGAAPRGSWHRAYFARKLSQNQRRLPL